MDADSWVTVQIIGGAPGMDEYRWYNEDFGRTHTFDPGCKIIHDVRLSIRAYDVDWAEGERDAIWVDGRRVGYLRGSDGSWHTTNFNIPPDWLNDGQ